MAEYTVHTSWLFDPKLKQARQNASITVDTESGLIVRVSERDEKKAPFSDYFKEGDVDLRGKYVLPGLVDAHTHVFLHSYEYDGRAISSPRKMRHILTWNVVRQGH